MNEDTNQDLKQFITTTVGQQISEVRDDIVNLDTKLSGKIEALDEKLTTQINDLSASVAEALHDFNETTDSQLKGHENRITALEKAVK